MEKEKLIENLYEARKLDTDTKYQLFEDSLDKLQGIIEINDIADLCKAFDDFTCDDEVMFGLVHLLETLKGEAYLKKIAVMTPDMGEAHEWAMTLNKRILNSTNYRKMYMDVINHMDETKREKICHLLKDIIKDNPDRFRDKAEEILKEVNS